MSTRLTFGFGVAAAFLLGGCGGLEPIETGPPQGLVAEDLVPAGTGVILTDPLSGIDIGWLDDATQTYIFLDGYRLPTQQIDTRHGWTTSIDGWEPGLPGSDPVDIINLINLDGRDMITGQSTAHRYPAVPVVKPDHALTGMPKAPTVIPGVKRADIARCWEATYNVGGSAILCSGCCAKQVCREDCVDLTPRADTAALMNRWSLDPIPPDRPPGW